MNRRVRLPIGTLGPVSHFEFGFSPRNASQYTVQTTPSQDQKSKKKQEERFYGEPHNFIPYCSVELKHLSADANIPYRDR
jgi:hypothetical protein